MLSKKAFTNCRHAEPRPLPLGCAPKGFYSGSNQTVSASSRLIKQGFTLIELLVVVLIIGILAAVAVPQYQKAVDKSYATQMLVNGKAVKDAQELYYLANGEYATSLEQLDIGVDRSSSYVTLIGCSTGTPYSAYVYHPKLSNTFIIWGYSKQCNGDGWKNRRVCYAPSNNQRANRFCAALAGVEVKAECGTYCTYQF